MEAVYSSTNRFNPLSIEETPKKMALAGGVLVGAYLVNRSDSVPEMAKDVVLTGVLLTGGLAAISGLFYSILGLESYYLSRQKEINDKEASKRKLEEEWQESMHITKCLAERGDCHL